MKTLTVGREPGCNIELNDDMASRRHALIKVYPTGKLEIVDLSVNGTFVNGMRAPRNKPYPVSRKDLVIFAHSEKLNWSSVPNPLKWIKWVLGGLILLILIIVGIILFSKLGSNSVSIEELGNGGGPSGVVQTDSTKKEKKEDGEKTKKNFFPKAPEKKTQPSNLQNPGTHDNKKKKVEDNNSNKQKVESTTNQTEPFIG